jgi:hypothetical protein
MCGMAGFKSLYVFSGAESPFWRMMEQIRFHGSHESGHPRAGPIVSSASSPGRRGMPGGESILALRRGS